MGTSVILMNGRAAALCGKKKGKGLSVSGFASVAMPEGAFINGTITDEDGVRSAIGDLANALPLRKGKCKLIINGSLIYTKRLSLPALPRKKLMGLIADEFSDVENASELAIDYTVIEAHSATGGTTILAAAAPTELLSAYTAVFSALGIKLDCIDVALSGEMKLFSALPNIREKTFISAVLDGNILHVSLFVKGVFRYQNRVRLLSERGAAEEAGEIGGVVSTLIQFNASERSGETITDVYFCGLRNDEAALLREIATTYNLSASVLPSCPDVVSSAGDFPLSDYMWLAGSIL